MKIVSSLALVVAVGWISGCSTVPESQISNVTLDATRINAGHLAQATMMPMGNQTQFWFTVTGEPQGTSLPGYLNSYIYSGSCSNLGSKPAYDLNHGPNSGFASRAAFQSFWKSAPVSVDALRTGEYVLVVRQAPADGNQNIFCGKLS
jgi:hypothetical protein